MVCVRKRSIPANQKIYYSCKFSQHFDTFMERKDFPSPCFDVILSRQSTISRPKLATIPITVSKTANWSEQSGLADSIRPVASTVGETFGALIKILPSAAIRINDRLSVGGSVGVAASHAELEGPFHLQSGPMPGAPALLDLQATGASVAWNLGLQYQINECTTVGLAYIEFALEKPAFFRAMWREEAIYSNDEEYVAASNKLSAHLKGGFSDTMTDEDPTSISPQELLAWSSVHGLANLFVDGPVAKGKTQAQKLVKAADMIQAMAPALK